MASTVIGFIGFSGCKAIETIVNDILGAEYMNSTNLRCCLRFQKAENADMVHITRECCGVRVCGDLSHISTFIDEAISSTFPNDTVKVCIAFKNPRGLFGNCFTEGDRIVILPPYDLPDADYSNIYFNEGTYSNLSQCTSIFVYLKGMRFCNESGNSKLIKWLATYFPDLLHRAHFVVENKETERVVADLHEFVNNAWKITEPALEIECHSVDTFSPKSTPIDKMVIKTSSNFSTVFENAKSNVKKVMTSYIRLRLPSEEDEKNPLSKETVFRIAVSGLEAALTRDAHMPRLWAAGYNDNSRSCVNFLMSIHKALEAATNGLGTIKYTREWRGETATNLCEIVMKEFEMNA